MPIIQIEYKSSLIDPLMEYITKETLPTDPGEARRIKRQAPWYVVQDNQLYQRLYSLPLLLCLRPSEADYILREVHKGISSNHFGGKILAYEIIQ